MTKEGNALGNCLVLLTKTYPYGKGEEFIEDEIPCLAKHFEKIIIFNLLFFNLSVNLLYKL